MKKLTVIFGMIVVMALCSCAIKSNTLFPSEPNSQEETSVDPAIVTEAPLPGATTSTQPVAEPVTSEEAPTSTGPIKLEGSGGGTIEIQAIPGTWGKAFIAFYITWFSREDQRFQTFRPLHTLKFNNVAPGDYFINLQWTTKRWVVETIPPVETEHRDLNGRVKIRLNGGPWHEFTSADTVKVVNPATGEAYWNFRVVVP